MAIDVNDRESLRKLTFDDLKKDAAERKDKDALLWLREQASATIERKREDGSIMEVSKPIIVVRAEYIRKYLNYKPGAKKLNTEEERKRKREKRVATLVGDIDAILAELE